MDNEFDFLGDFLITKIYENDNLEPAIFNLHISDTHTYINIIKSQCKASVDKDFLNNIKNIFNKLKNNNYKNHGFLSMTCSKLLPTLPTWLRKIPENKLFEYNKSSSINSHIYERVFDSSFDTRRTFNRILKDYYNVEEKQSAMAEMITNHLKSISLDNSTLFNTFFELCPSNRDLLDREFLSNEYFKADEKARNKLKDIFK